NGITNVMATGVPPVGPRKGRRSGPILVGWRRHGRRLESSPGSHEALIAPGPARRSVPVIALAALARGSSLGPMSEMLVSGFDPAACARWTRRFEAPGGAFDVVKGLAAMPGRGRPG